MTKLTARQRRNVSLTARQFYTRKVYQIRCASLTLLTFDFGGLSFIERFKTDSEVERGNHR